MVDLNRYLYCWTHGFWHVRHYFAGFLESPHQMESSHNLQCIQKVSLLSSIRFLSSIPVVRTILSFICHVNRYIKVFPYSIQLLRSRLASIARKSMGQNSSLTQLYGSMQEAYQQMQTPLIYQEPSVQVHSQLNLFLSIRYLIIPFI